MIFKDTENSLGFLHNYNEAYKDLVRDGFFKVPSNHAPPDDNYDYRCVGFDLFMKMKYPIVKI